MRNKGEVKEVQEDIDVMNKSFNDLYGDEDEPSTDAPTTDAPVDTKTEPPTTDAPVATDAPTTDEPKTEPPTTDAPVIDERDQTIIDLRAKLAEKALKPKPTAAPTTLPPLNLDPQDFIGDEDVETLTDNKEALNKLLNSVYSRGVSDSRKIVGENVANAIPNLISAHTDLVTKMKEIKDNFYATNEDLRPFPNVVSTIFEEIAKQDPNQTYDNIINSIAPEARKRLNLPEYKPKTKTEPKKGEHNKDNPPKLPRKKGKSGRAANESKPSSLESELDEMNKTLRR